MSVHHRLRLYLRLPDADQIGNVPVVGRGVSRFPRKELPHMPVSSTTPSRPSACVSALGPVALKALGHDARLMPAKRTSHADHSGSPALRMPSAYLAKSSGRCSGVWSLRLDTRNAGSI